MDLNNATVATTLAVTDVNRAKDFYGNKLGLEEVGSVIPAEAHKEIVYKTGQGTYVCLYERPEPAGSKATSCTFDVKDVDRTVNDLRDKGVTFEEYDIPEMGIKTRNGVAEMGDFKGAWFRDPDGNILGISNGLVLLEEGRTPIVQRA